MTYENSSRREGMEARVLWDAVSFTSTSPEYDHEKPLEKKEFCLNLFLPIRLKVD